jgi:hypothetical protein
MKFAKATLLLSQCSLLRALRQCLPIFFKWQPYQTGVALIGGMFVWLVADGWCWFVLREKYCWLICFERKVLLSGG